MSKIEILNEIALKILKPYPKNPFDHSGNINDIANSLRDFGYNKISIGVDENNVLLYGHGTLAAAKLLGWTTIPHVAKISGLTEDQKKIYRVADNTTSMSSKIISKMLKEEFSHQLSFDFESYGMPEEYLFDMEPLNTTDSCKKTADEFNKENPDFMRPEKLWMYIEFQTKQQWEQAIRLFGKNRSRRVLDTDKIMGVINERLSKEEVITESAPEIQKN